MSNIGTELVNMQSQTAITQSNTRKTGMENDSNMFLTLMLKQLENQDPTEPTDNTEWLSQLAQYSSLEQMAQMNSGLANCMDYLAAFYADTTANAEITQTLSLIGKEVTLEIDDPEHEGEKLRISGVVSEASFEDGTGKIKVNDEYYSIANIISIREKA